MRSIKIIKKEEVERKICSLHEVFHISKMKLKIEARRGKRKKFNIERSINIYQKNKNASMEAYTL